MAEYLFIESRDPFESKGVARQLDLAMQLVSYGNTASIFLVQNGVLAARKGRGAGTFSAAAKIGIKVIADELSVNERGISALADGISIAPLETVVDHLEAGHKVIWN